MAKKKLNETNYPIVIETFQEINSYLTSLLTQKEPSCFNFSVRIKKYKITIEEIEEPNEVYEQRLQELWDKCTNYHHRTPLKEAAKKINYTIKK